MLEYAFDGFFDCGVIAQVFPFVVGIEVRIIVLIMTIMTMTMGVALVLVGIHSRLEGEPHDVTCTYGGTAGGCTGTGTCTGSEDSGWCDE